MTILACTSQGCRIGEALQKYRLFFHTKDGSYVVAGREYLYVWYSLVTKGRGQRT